MLGAVMAHISVNAFNEYFDFKSGLDLQTRRTPFSGGSGTLVNDPEASVGALGIAIVSLVATALIGLYFLSQQQDALWLFALIGIGGLVLVFCYTNVITRMPLLCLLSAGFGFGPLMVSGSFLALTGTINTAALWISVVVFGVVNNLLLVAQIPDMAADSYAGRHTWPMKHSPATVVATYLSLAGVSAAGLIAGIVNGDLPFYCGLALPVLSLSFVVAAGVGRYADDTAKMIPFMALNVAVAILTPAALAAGFYW